MFGADVWVKVDAASKLDPKSAKARWVGYDKASKGHRIWWPGTTRISVERNVIFVDSTSGEEVLVPLEGESLAESEQNAPSSPNALLEKPSQPAKTPPHVENAPEIDDEPIEELTRRIRKPSQWARSLRDGTGSTGGRGAQKVPLSVLPETAETAKAVVGQGEIFEQIVAGLAATNIGDDEDDAPLYALAAMRGDEPTSGEALKGPEREAWRSAMQAEMDALRRKEVFDGPMDAPDGANIVRSHWVLRKKRDEENVVPPQICLGLNSR
jgi:hypothetical protein